MIATIGYFDGMHEGHRYVISHVMQLAEKRGDGSIIFTFDRHPATLFRPDRVPQPLLTPEEKMEKIAACGVDDAVMFEFDADFASITSREFLEIIREDYGVTTLLLGYDNHFGQKETDDDGNTITPTFADYQRMGQETGVNIRLLTPLSDTPTSSTMIRRLLLDGNITEANSRLGYRYRISGTVVSGEQIGRQIGFPTANINVEGKLIPKSGVYAVEVCCPEPRKALLNIGSRPTFGGNGNTIEAHILDYNGNLYGNTIAVEFLQRIRDEQHFPTPEELIRQINRDMERVKAL